MDLKCKSSTNSLYLKPRNCQLLQLEFTTNSINIAIDNKSTLKKPAMPVVHNTQLQFSTEKNFNDTIF